MTENEIGKIVIDTAIHIHKELGPGLFEIVYEAVLARLLTKHGLKVERQVAIPFRFENELFDEAFRADIIVEGKVILELKSVEKINPVHKKQLTTYLKLTGIKLGYVLNFGEELMKTGIVRMINGLEE
jgi:GxxExxY protein